MENNKIKHLVGLVSDDILLRKNEPELPTGISGLDNVIWGIKRKELTVVAGRTSHGKTMLMMQIAWNLADKGKKVAIFSMEMSNEAVAERIIAMNCNIISEDLERNNLTADQKVIMQSFREHMADNELYVHDDKGFTFTDINEYCKLNKPDALFIDYIQMIHAQGQSDRESYGEYCRQAKKMAKENNVAIMIGSQANRGSVEGKAIPDAPRLENCKGSGVIEENPDVVLLVHYPAKHDPKAPRDEYHIVVAKKRNGRTGTVIVRVIPEYYKIF